MPGPLSNATMSSHFPCDCDVPDEQQFPSTTVYHRIARRFGDNDGGLFGGYFIHSQRFGQSWAARRASPVEVWSVRAIFLG